MGEVSIAAIKQVRARCDVGIAEAKAALIAHGGNVEAAVAQLITPERRLLDERWAMTQDLAREGATKSTSTTSGRVVHVERVEMDPSAAQHVTTFASELRLFLNAVPAACRMVTLERSWNRFEDGTSQLTVAASFASEDPERDRDRIVVALGKHDLTRLPDDLEWHRAAFADRAGGCFRTWVQRDAELRVLLRIDALVPSDESAGAAMLTEMLAGYAKMTSAPTRVRSIWEVTEGRWVVEAVYTNPGTSGGQIHVTDRGGALSITFS
jgi:hypothetical protein